MVAFFLKGVQLRQGTLKKLTEPKARTKVATAREALVGLNTGRLWKSCPTWPNVLERMSHLHP